MVGATLPRVQRTFKALAYVLQGEDLLVFTQPESPEAGLQVPAGTIQPGETPGEAVVRELEEETGIDDVRDLELLGTATYDMRKYGREELQERYFFRITLASEPPRQWRWHERHDGLSPAEPFELFWMPAAEAAGTLEARQGELLDKVAAADRRVAGA